PRLFVYHTTAISEGDKTGSERFKIMERKLYRGIMNPSMIVALVLGLWMLFDRWAVYFKQAMWMHIKLTLIILLIGYHHMCGAYVKKFARDANTRTHVFYRVFNELPVFVMIPVVILVVLKQPF